MPKPIILVAGITRSGLTVTMQMLDKGGFPCIGERPAFEKYDIGKIPWNECCGKAVKLVDPQLHMPPKYRVISSRGTASQKNYKYRIIRLRRNPKQQAKSINKFGKLLLGLPPLGQVALLKGLKKDYKVLNKWSKKYDCLDLRFEDILEDPLKSAKVISEWIKKPLNIDAMASCVIKRDSNCHPELDLYEKTMD